MFITRVPFITKLLKVCETIQTLLQMNDPTFEKTVTMFYDLETPKKSCKNIEGVPDISVV